jgi:hypothetical protein
MNAFCAVRAPRAEVQLVGEARCVQRSVRCIAPTRQKLLPFCPVWATTLLDAGLVVDALRVTRFIYRKGPKPPVLNTRRALRIGVLVRELPAYGSQMCSDRLLDGMPSPLRVEAFKGALLLFRRARP